MIGYVVLKRTPNPYREDPWDYETIGDVYADLFDAEYSRNCLISGRDAKVEYVIGEIREWNQPPDCECNCDECQQDTHCRVPPCWIIRT